MISYGGWQLVDMFSLHRCCSNLQKEGWEICWLGHQRSNGGTACTKAWYPLRFIQISGLRGKGIKALLGAPLLF